MHHALKLAARQPAKRRQIMAEEECLSCPSCCAVLPPNFFGKAQALSKDDLISRKRSKKPPKKPKESEEVCDEYLSDRKVFNLRVKMAKLLVTDKKRHEPFIEALVELIGSSKPPSLDEVKQLKVKKTVISPGLALRFYQVFCSKSRDEKQKIREKRAKERKKAVKKSAK
jgi:hypothetical protein